VGKQPLEVRGEKGGNRGNEDMERTTGTVKSRKKRSFIEVKKTSKHKTGGNKERSEWKKGGAVAGQFHVDGHV